MESNFAEVFDRHHLLIRKYIQSRIDDGALSEDLTSEVFVRAYAAQLDGRGVRTSETGWLYRIARNLVIDHYRRRARRQEFDIDDFVTTQHKGLQPDALVIIGIDVDRLFSAMNMLTDAQRQVIRMRFIEGYPFAEIACEMEKTVGAVKQLQHRALEQLRWRLRIGDER